MTLFKMIYSETFYTELESCKNQTLNKILY
jgi:hypothetical protein